MFLSLDSGTLLIDMKQIHILILLLMTVLGAGCQDVSQSDSGMSSGKGKVVFSLSGEYGVFVKAETRANPPVSSLTFTISGTTTAGEEVNSQPLVVTTDGSSSFAYVDAGSYTITATYKPSAAGEGNGEICYQGSSTFSVTVGGTTPVSITLRPSNVKVSVVLDASLNTFYGTAKVSFTSPRSVEVASSSDVYLDAGTITYSVAATPLNNSGASAFSKSGCTFVGEAGKSYTISIGATSTGEIIFGVANTTSDEEVWEGEFS